MRGWIILFLALSASRAGAVAFLDSKTLCYNNVAEMFSIITTCKWDASVVGSGNKCSGLLNCKALDPKTLNYPIDNAKCDNGSNVCGNLTASCKASWKQNELNACAAIVPYVGPPLYFPPGFHP